MPEPAGITSPASASEYNGAPASPEDREHLGDFCDWYAEDLQRQMDTVSAFLGAFGAAGGDYSDARVEDSAPETVQAAGEAVDALNGFLAGFPDGLSGAALRAVLGLRDSMGALSSAIRYEQGPEQINTDVALFDAAYKALRPACAQ